MCIQFAYVNNDAAEDEWQVIIINNRDEFYTRPTRPAGYWGDNYISGIDLRPGREGGTWLGINCSNGKIGSLLHVMTKKQYQNKKGRGNLVTNFLKTSKSTEDFLLATEEEGKQYYPFNLVLMEYIDGKWVTHYYSNQNDSLPQEITEDTYGISNSIYEHPWQKVIHGRNTFNSIVDKYKKKDQINQLHDELMALLNDNTSHMPDPVLETECEEEYVASAISSINIDSKLIKYGTRTNTVIYIDTNGKGKYIERTMDEPVDRRLPVWSTRTMHFQIGQQNSQRTIR